MTDGSGNKGQTIFDEAEARSDQSASGKRRALVVGIDNYAPPNALPSCVNDAQVFASSLRQLFNFNDIRLLTNEKATKAGTLENLNWLFSGASAEDRLVFFFSGHGFRPAQNGVAVDALVTQDSEFLTNDEFAMAMAKLPDGVLSIVLDTCFSGDMEKLFTRSDGQVEFGKIKRWIPTTATAIGQHQDDLKAVTSFSSFGSLSPSTAAAVSKQIVNADGGDQDAPGSSVQFATLHDKTSKGLLLSACLGNEEATASTSQTQGCSAFTFSLVEAIRALGTDETSADLINSAGTRLRSLGLQQTPMLKEPPEPPHLGSRSFLLFRTITGTTEPGDVTNISSPLGGMPPSELTEIVARVAVAVVTYLQRNKTMQALSTNQKDWNDIARLISVVGPTLASMQTNGSQNANGAGKDFIGDVGRVVDIASKVTSIIGALQSKGIQMPTGDAGKSFITDLVNTTLQVLPVVANLQSKSYQNSNGGDGKAFLGDNGWDPRNEWSPTVDPIWPAGLQSANGTNGKSFLGDVANVVSIASQLVPLVAAMQSNGSQMTNGGSGKDWTDILHTVLTTVPFVTALQSTGSQTANGGPAKNWTDIVRTVIPIAVAVATA